MASHSHDLHLNLTSQRPLHLDTILVDRTSAYTIWGNTVQSVWQEGGTAILGLMDGKIEEEMHCVYVR